jgi:hypothetical protein
MSQLVKTKRQANFRVLPQMNIVICIYVAPGVAENNATFSCKDTPCVLLTEDIPV